METLRGAGGVAEHLIVLLVVYSLMHKPVTCAVFHEALYLIFTVQSVWRQRTTFSKLGSLYLDLEAFVCAGS